MQLSDDEEQDDISLSATYLLQFFLSLFRRLFAILSVL